MTMPLRFVKSLAVPSCLLAAGLSLACGAAAPAQRLRYAHAELDGARQLDWSQPIELVFEPGDRLPIQVSFSDQAFELVPAAPPLELVARRHCVVRIEKGRITKSLDGDFSASPVAPGSFRFGIAITPEGKHLELAVSTPRQAEPAAAAPSPAQPRPEK
jgi:hypothetical protein